MSKAIDHRETSDTYGWEVFRHKGHRIIRCKENIQWIIQRRKTGAGARWEAFSYCVTQKALSRVWTAHTGGTVPDFQLMQSIIFTGRISEANQNET